MIYLHWLLDYSGNTTIKSGKCWRGREEHIIEQFQYDYFDGDGDGDGDGDDGDDNGEDVCTPVDKNTQSTVTHCQASRWNTITPYVINEIHDNI